MDNITIERPWMGLYHMQVCCKKESTNEEILECCNKENPSGTSLGWTTVVRSGDNKPGQCKNYPGRLHIIVSC